MVRSWFHPVTIQDYRLALKPPDPESDQWARFDFEGKCDEIVHDKTPDPRDHEPGAQSPAEPHPTFRRQPWKKLSIRICFHLVN